MKPWHYAEKKGDNFDLKYYTAAASESCYVLALSSRGVVKYYNLEVVANGTKLKPRRVVARLFRRIYVNHLAIAGGLEQKAVVAIGNGLKIERRVRRRCLGLKEIQKQMAELEGV